MFSLLVFVLLVGLSVSLAMKMVKLQQNAIRNRMAERTTKCRQPPKITSTKEWQSLFEKIQTSH